MPANFNVNELIAVENQPGIMLYSLAVPIKEKKTLGEDWFNRLVRENFKLPTPPRIGNDFIKAFIAANNLSPINPRFPFQDTKTLVGIEVEVENVTHIDPNIPLCFWQIDEDGSLRNHGKEFKTYALPIKYAQLALEQLFRGLNPDIDFSSRTSIHVHLNVQGLTINQLLTLLFTYTTVENLLFKFAGASRRNSIFCTPITETNLVSGLDIRNSGYLANHFKGTWQKYSALNFNPVHTFGTVEFRQMPGTSDITKLCIWLELLSRIRLYSYQNNLATVLDVISNLNTNSQYYKFVDSIFGDLTPYLDTTTLLNDMERAVYICKNCTAVNKFHHDVINTWTNEESQTNKLFGRKKTPQTVLSKDQYQVFRQLFNEGSGGYNEYDFFFYIKAHSKEYIRAFPHLEGLIQLIKMTDL